jgi:hypothetical protein
MFLVWWQILKVAINILPQSMLPKSVLLKTIYAKELLAKTLSSRFWSIFETVDF